MINGGGPLDLTIVLRYRKAANYGHNVLLAALEEYPTPVRHKVRFGTDIAGTVAAIRAGLREAGSVMVLWSFRSPDAAALASELAEIRSAAPGAVHVAGGVHATAEPAATLDAGWDVAAVGEGEATLLGLVEVFGAQRPLASVPGLVFRPEPLTRPGPLTQPEPAAEGRDDGLVRTGRVDRAPLERYRAFPVVYRRFNPIEITRGCRYTCRFCQTPFMFGARWRHRSPANVRWHVRRMREAELRDLRFITPSALSYGSEDDQPNLPAVEELLAGARDEIGPDGRVFFGSFPSEIRPEHLSVEALRLIRRYCANDNLIVGAQSGSQRVLDAAKRGHTVEDVRRAVRLGVAEGFRINVDMIFGMPGEEPPDGAASLALAQELADLGARIHAHTFMPLPGTPWRDATPAQVDPAALREADRLARRGALYGQWRRQWEHAHRLAADACAYPRRRRTPAGPAPG